MRKRRQSRQQRQVFKIVVDHDAKKLLRWWDMASNDRVVNKINRCKGTGISKRISSVSKQTNGETKKARATIARNFDG
ncbi:hypothetical protein QCA50_011329 [Cerrena zonata]|uniref:Uncharacterized protein n=1 Tax=Cerrena zonata TaxID=2478898 RepID=A0AAW0G8Y6_9APHY